MIILKKIVPVMERTTKGTTKRGTRGIKAIGAITVVNVFAKSIVI